MRSVVPGLRVIALDPLARARLRIFVSYQGRYLPHPEEGDMRAFFREVLWRGFSSSLRGVSR